MFGPFCLELYLSLLKSLSTAKISDFLSQGLESGIDARVGIFFASLV